MLKKLRYRLARRVANMRHKPHHAQGIFETPGAVKSFERHERGLIVSLQNGALRLTVIAPDCVQVRFQQSGKFPVPFSYAVAKISWPETPFTVSEDQTCIRLATDQLICQIDRRDGRLTWLDKQGQSMAQDAEPIQWREGEFRLTRVLPADELCLGLAAQPVSLDLRGKRYLLWNTDPIGTARDKIPSYFTIPFYLGAHKTFSAGLFWDNPSRGYVDVGAAKRDQLTFCGSLDELRYYQFAGRDPLAVLARYTELTGRMPMPPLWALGFHISRWSYTPASRVLEVAQELRQRQIPCDAIYLDIDYMDGYRCFTWHPEHFRAPAVLLSELAKLGFKTVAILDPGIKADPTFGVYQNGLREGVFVTYPNGKPFVGPCWPGDAVYPDFTDPKARAWWGAQFDTLLKPGIDGVWNDMNEPVIFHVGTLPDSVQHKFDSAEGKPATHVLAHNVYGMLMARASREALEKARPDLRPFNIVRAAYAGAQRYASTWTGDNRSDWDHLRLAISMTLNSGLSGLAFNGPDVGGFFEDCEPELFARFVALGCLMPYFRVHTANGTTPQEPWAFGPEVEAIARKFINLRYELLPYLYSHFAQCAQHGTPILRPLFMADLTDDKLRAVEDTFMVGDSLLVAPILDKGKTEREVYLPAGRWYDFFSGRAYSGGQTHKLRVPLDTLPLFIRGGHVVPLWPVQQHTREKPIDELTLKIGRGDGEITLYEDAGEGLEYQQGAYRWMYFTLRPSPDGGLTVSWRRAGKYQPNYERVRCIVYGIEETPDQVQIDGSAAPLWYYEKGALEFTANKPFEQARITIPEAADRKATLIRSPLRDRD